MDVSEPPLVRNLVGGGYTSVSAGVVTQIHSPATGECVAHVNSSCAEDVESAVTEAKSAWFEWKARSAKDRSLFVRKFLFLLSNFAKEVADLVVKESGRNTQEALNDVSRAIEAVESAVSTSMQVGSRQLETAAGEYVNEKNLPLGVVASIPSRSSSVLSVMWTVPTALVLGNCVILKPDSQNALSMRRLTELFLAAGFPAGVFQVIHGDAEITHALCGHAGVAAVAFAGTSQAAKEVMRRCQATNKRVVAYGGGKNHVFALPDCDVNAAARDVVEAFTGCAGQRVLAASVLVLVSDGSEYGRKALTATLLQEVVAMAGKIDAGLKAGQMGPVASAADRDRILSFINEAEAGGAKILLDGRSWATERPAGYWVGPTIILHSSVDDRAMKEEIFGPVLSVYCASSWDEAISIENNNAYGLASSVYSDRGAQAEWFAQRFRAGMQGINECFPSSREPVFLCPAEGTLSKYGSHDLTADGAVQFFSTRTRVTSRWVAPSTVFGAASPSHSVCSPLSAPSKSANSSPMMARKGVFVAPPYPELLPPMRRNSSNITRDPFSRENSAVSECTLESDGDITTVVHYAADPVAPPKAAVFHGIAATSPFASSDSHFDFELERLRAREDSFNPCYSVQPSFDGDPRVAFPMERGNSDISAVSGASSGLSRESSFSVHASKKYYNVDLYAVDELSAAQIGAVDALSSSVGPLEAQYKYRASAARFLKKQLRKALQCNVFETNMQALRSFLPTDPIKLSVVLIGRLEPCWQTLVRDGFTKLQSATGAESAEAQAAEGKHQVKKVDVIRIGNTNDHKVHCLCDVTEVEITLNSRNDICLMAFLEEVDNLIGEESLFKRSVLLVRAWWEYETTDSFESPLTRQVLSESALAIMVCAVFNQYHARISSPLQALSLFLAEYSAYDGATHAITLQGIVPFRSADSNQLVFIEPTKKHLISASLIEKYWQVFHVDDVVKAKSPSANPNGNPNASAVPPTMHTEQAMLFMRDAFNVLHPFEGSNMVRAGKAPERKPIRLSKAFSDGARGLSLALSRPVAVAGLDNELIDTFFPISKARFTGVTRPDAFPASTGIAGDVLPSPRNNNFPNMNVSVDKLWQNIMYCNFIIKSVVSESAILTFCIDVLSMMGLLTADDLGKRLNEASKVPQVMVTLKEQVGGLKEFLKRFPDVFIFSYEHPYNPHVFLRISLTPELQAEVENGVLPVKLLSHIIAKFGRIAPPPPKVDSPSLRRGKMLSQQQQLQHQQQQQQQSQYAQLGRGLDENVVFGHERSAGGANTLRLMQTDLDLASVNDPLSTNGSMDSDASSLDKSTMKLTQLSVNPYAPPFVPQQQQQPQTHGLRALSGPDLNMNVMPVRKGMSLNDSTSSPLALSGQNSASNASLYSDLGLMSNSVLNAGGSLGMPTSLSGGTNGKNSSVSGAGLMFQGSDNLEGLLEARQDYFGDSMSSLGEPRSFGNAVTGADAARSTGGNPGGFSTNNGGGHMDLLSSLRENSLEFRDTLSPDDFSQELNLSVNPALSGGGNTSLGSRTQTGGFTGGNRGPRYPGQQQTPDMYGDYDTGVPGLDSYHHATGGPRGRSYPATQGHSNPELYQRSSTPGQDEYSGSGAGGADLYGGGGYGAYGAAASDNHSGGGGYHYGAQQQQMHGQGPYGGGPRGPMVRSNSRPLMLSQHQQQQGQQQQMMGSKFQHKRYDPTQQFKK